MPDTTVRVNQIRGLTENSIIVGGGNGRGTGATPSQTRTLLGLGSAALSDVGDFASASSLDDKADLVGGVIPTSQLPSLAVVEYLGEVANQSAMLALSGERGDWCIRTDTGSTWVLSADDSNLLVSWVELSYPAAPVTSINGQTGTVVLDAADVGAAAESHGHTLSDISDAGTAAAADTGDFATSAQGALADSALQPADIASGTITPYSGDLDFSGGVGGGGSPAWKVPLGQYFTGPVAILNPVSFTANRIAYSPIKIEYEETWTRIGVRVSSGIAGMVRIGMYSDDHGAPGTLVFDAGEASTASTGDIEFTISQTLSPGIYWFAMTSSANLQTAAQSPTGNQIPWTTTSISAQVGFWLQYFGPYAPLPSTPGTITAMAGGNGPRLWLRKV